MKCFRPLGILLCFCTSLVFSQTKPPAVQQAGDCSVNINGNNNTTASLVCNEIDPKLAEQVRAIINGTHRNENAIRDMSEKLDRILKQMAQPVARPAQNCPGGICAGGDITGSPTINLGPPEPNITSTYTCGVGKPGTYQCVITLHTDKELDRNIAFRLGFDETIDRFAVDTSVAKPAFFSELVTQDNSQHPNNILRFSLMLPTSIPANGEIYVTVTSKKPIHSIGWQRGL
jgi:hypothetical protein